MIEHRIILLFILYINLIFLIKNATQWKLIQQKIILIFCEIWLKKKL